MKAIFVRNLSTALIANSISKIIKEDILVIIYSGLTKKDEDRRYQNLILDQLNTSNFSVIIKLPFTNGWNSFIENLPNGILRSIIYRFDLLVRIRIRKTFYFSLLSRYDIDEVILAYIDDRVNEATLMYIAEKKNIKISIYEEVLFPDYFKGVFNLINHSWRNKTLVSKFDSIFDIIFNLKKIKGYKYSTFKSFYSYFSLFPEIYNYNNVLNKNKIHLMLPKNDTLLHSLFLTSPFYESGRVKIDEEILVLKSVIKEMPNNTYIKFHPQDSLEKKKMIRDLAAFLELPSELENLPAELIINNSNIQWLGGYFTSTLFIAHSINLDISINSYILRFGSNLINVNHIKKVKSRFSSINFHN